MTSRLRFRIVEDPVFTGVILIGGWFCGVVAIETAVGCGTVWTLVPALLAWRILEMIASPYSGGITGHRILAIVVGGVFHAAMFLVFVRGLMGTGKWFGFESADRKWQILAVLLPLFFVLISYTLPASDCP